MKYGLDNTSINRLQDIFTEFPQVEKVILYGSRAKGNYKPGSDIDLTIDGKGLSLSIVNQISLKIEDLLLPYTIDLSVLSHIKDQGLIDHIKRIGIDFYKRENQLKV